MCVARSWSVLNSMISLFWRGMWHVRGTEVTGCTWSFGNAYNSFPRRWWMDDLATRAFRENLLMTCIAKTLYFTLKWMPWRSGAKQLEYDENVVWGTQVLWRNL